ncbi:Crp/Fnr family transcriptional regulator [Pararhodonellum marinum]|uniref:Crp/Fnr family transcriptional regulator n=1 Tax=Pararhodonellum marinum TaxID=2755358 RepID=UPI0018901577|nr:Crp/Fnr family transcriptional regulator [Pararhodonellum marinum]
MSLLKNSLKSLVNFDPETLDLLVSKFSQVQLAKSSVFAKKGEFSKQIGFVESGVLRAYFSMSNGEQYNKTFFTQGSFVGAYSSLVTGQSNLIDIDCLTDCTLCIASFESIKSLYDQYPPVERLARILAERFFVNKEKREIELATLEAKERYAIFLEENPHLDQLIPQYHIASYLGVTPTQLSRIRRQK